jgi:thiamine biosynthesis lipoprotein ApbE
MASPLRLTVAADVPDAAAEAAWASVVDEFEAAEQAMSRFRETSELTVANRAAVHADWAPAGPWLRRGLVAADRAHRLTAVGSTHGS